MFGEVRLFTLIGILRHQEENFEFLTCIRRHFIDSRLNTAAAIHRYAAFQATTEMEDISRSEILTQVL